MTKEIRSCRKYRFIGVSEGTLLLTHPLTPPIRQNGARCLVDAGRQRRGPSHNAVTHLDTQTVQLTGANITATPEFAGEFAQELVALLDRNRGG